MRPKAPKHAFSRKHHILRQLSSPPLILAVESLLFLSTIPLSTRPLCARAFSTIVQVRALKMQDWKIKDHVFGLENIGPTDSRKT